MKGMLKQFVRDEAGQDLIEYGLLVGIITAACVVAVRSIGSTVVGFYTTLIAALAS